MGYGPPRFILWHLGGLRVVPRIVGQKTSKSADEGSLHKYARTLPEDLNVVQFETKIAICLGGRKTGARGFLWIPVPLMENLHESSPVCRW